tara:strand:- start:2834 stop:3334 length:501 start_codon:yes stop_codon:yes gene_type:complete
MKAMVGLVIAILIIFIANLFWPSNQVSDRKLSSEYDSIEQGKSTEEATNSSVILSTDLNVPSDDEKIKLMTAEYEILEKERKNLKRRLSRLKHDMWGQKFAPETAKKMSEIMLSSHKLIKNPDMLGAFSNVKGIQDEIAKIKFAESSIEQVSELIEENKKSNMASD